MTEIIHIELDDDADPTNLVHELDRRDLDAALALDGDTVLVAIPADGDGEPLVLEPLVAVEGWLAKNGEEEARVILDGTEYVVRRRARADVADANGAVRRARPTASSEG